MVSACCKSRADGLHYVVPNGRTFVYIFTHSQVHTGDLLTLAVESIKMNYDDSLYSIAIMQVDQYVGD